MKKRIIEDKGLAFGIRISNMVDYLRSKKVGVNLDQILRSGTSIGANVCEGTYAQSTADYITKHTIALKEANETRFWIEINYGKGYLTEREYVSIHNDVIEIIKILTAIIKKSKGI